jgi:L-threonylcarbamoyladenylate synthase
MAVEIRKVDPREPERAVVEVCAEEILRGRCVSFLTDTFYGLGCSLMDGSAVEMIFRLKHRPPDLAIISLISDPGSVEALALEVPQVADQLMRRFWPGPLSIIFRASPLIPASSRGPKDTIALRYPDHRLSHDLIEAVGGPVVATSANRTGDPPARTADEVGRIFGNQLALILDAGRATATQPSTLVDVSSGQARLLRAGAVDVGEFVSVP